MDTVSHVTGYLDVGVVELKCEVHGFLRSTSPPTWLDKNGTSVYANMTKYIAILDSEGAGSQTAIQISSGAITQSLRSTLIIRQLEEGDAGSYTCVVDGNLSIVHLRIISTCSSKHFPYLYQYKAQNYFHTESSGIQTAAVVSVISLLITAVIAVSVVLLGVFVYSKCRSKITPTTNQRSKVCSIYDSGVVNQIGEHSVTPKGNEAYGAVRDRHI